MMADDADREGREAHCYRTMRRIADIWYEIVAQVNEEAKAADPGGALALWAEDWRGFAPNGIYSVCATGIYLYTWGHEGVPQHFASPWGEWVFMNSFGGTSASFTAAVDRFRARVEMRAVKRELCIVVAVDGVAQPAPTDLPRAILEGSDERKEAWRRIEAMHRSQGG